MHQSMECFEKSPRALVQVPKHSVTHHVFLVSFHYPLALAGFACCLKRHFVPAIPSVYQGWANGLLLCTVTSVKIR